MKTMDIVLCVLLVISVGVSIWAVKRREEMEVNRVNLSMGRILRMCPTDDFRLTHVVKVDGNDGMVISCKIEDKYCTFVRVEREHDRFYAEYYTEKEEAIRAHLRILNSIDAVGE